MRHRSKLDVSHPAVLAIMAVAVMAGCMVGEDEADLDDPSDLEEIADVPGDESDLESDLVTFAAKKYCTPRDFVIWTQFVATGNKVTVIDHHVIRFTNCSSKTIRRKPDIAWAPDLSCRSIKPNATTSWGWQTSNGFSYFRGLKGC